MQPSDRCSRVLRGPGELPPAFAEPVRSGATGPDPAASAYERGLADGLARGAEQARRGYEDELGRIGACLAAGLEQLVRLERSWRAEHEQAMVELALGAAAKMLRAKIESGDPVAARAVREALDALPSTGTIRARVHPEDLPLVRAALGEEARRSIELVADATLERGGAIVGSELGTLDATIGTALASVQGAASCDGAEPP
jgi:flagellar biosynthesis/type III secretory pathway protein FliH